MNKKGIINAIEKKVKPILKENGVKRAGIFGSYVRGEQNKDSDVDILVEISDEFSLLFLVSLKRTLSDALKKNVDLVEYSTILPELKKQILDEEVKIL